VASSCEHGDEHLGTINGGEFLEYLSDFWLLKKVCPPLSYFINEYEVESDKNAFGRYAVLLSIAVL
jgi:hypothetical protein